MTTLLKLCSKFLTFAVETPAVLPLVLLGQFYVHIKVFQRVKLNSDTQEYQTINLPACSDFRCDLFENPQLLLAAAGGAVVGALVQHPLRHLLRCLHHLNAVVLRSPHPLSLWLRRHLQLSRTTLSCHLHAHVQVLRQVK